MVQILSAGLKKLFDELVGTLAKNLVPIIIAALVAVWGFIAGHPEIGIMAVVVVAALTLVFIGTWLGRRLTLKQLKPKEVQGKWENFRELLLYIEKDSNGTPRVINRRIQTARCGRDECMQEIVGSDRHFDGRVHYLMCKDGHYVGSTTKYEDFVKQREVEDKQREEEENREGERMAQEYEQKQKDLKAGEITQEEFDIWEQTEDRRAFISPYVVRSFMKNEKLPRDEQDFYDRLVYDYESEQMRQILKTSLRASKN